MRRWSCSRSVISMATFSRLLTEFNVTWSSDVTWSDDVITNSTLGEAGSQDSGLAVTLAVVAAVCVLLALVTLFIALLIWRLHRGNGAEPRLLTFSQSQPDLTSRDAGGIINKAYESPVTSRTDAKPDDVTTESASERDADVTADRKLNPSSAVPEVGKRAAPKVPPRRSSRPGTGSRVPPPAVTSVHSENGLSECVNPLYDRNTPLVVGLLPLESISEEDRERSNPPSPACPSQGKENTVNDSDHIFRDVDHTFRDVDHTSSPAVNMADPVSSTQSCPNSPFMSSPGGVTRHPPPGGRQTNWASDSRLVGQSEADLEGQERDEGQGQVLHSSWRGKLDETWEAQTSF